MKQIYKYYQKNHKNVQNHPKKKDAVWNKTDDSDNCTKTKTPRQKYTKSETEQ